MTDREPFVGKNIKDLFPKVCVEKMWKCLDYYEIGDHYSDVCYKHVFMDCLSQQDLERDKRVIKK